MKPAASAEKEPIKRKVGARASQRQAPQLYIKGGASQKKQANVYVSLQNASTARKKVTGCVSSCNSIVICSRTPLMRRRHARAREALALKFEPPYRCLATSGSLNIDLMRLAHLFHASEFNAAPCCAVTFNDFAIGTSSIWRAYWALGSLMPCARY